MKPFQFNRKIAVAVLAVAGMGAQAAALSEAEVRRFLQHATFGPTVGNVIDVTATGKQAWLQQQFAQSGSDYRNLSYVDPNRNIGCPNDTTGACRRANYSLFPVQVQFFNNAINQPDQLRQRTALALSEILVVSGTTIKLPYAMANYQRIFLNNAFGNFRTILRDVTLSPAMGRYLNMANNDKPNPAKGIEPNENYAREVLQLFSIGLWQLNPDGTQVVGANGQPVPSYDQETVEGFAHVFTGWTYPPRPTATNTKFPNKESYQSPMIAFEDHHDTGPKILLSGVVLPAGQSAVADMEAAVTNIFNHPNVGPFIGRQLIQQLVTANPSPAYVARVTAAFNGASGTPRGDMKTVLTAILLDPEATTPLAPEKFGKLREPILQLTHLFRTLGGVSDGVWLRSQSSSLGQPVFSPPTVFSFFSPDMDLPDDPTLDGPAFGLFNASNAFKLSGILSTALNGIGVAPDSRWLGATGSKIDLTRLQALAADPVALMREINKLMFAGGASSALQQSLIRAAQIAPATKPLDRAKAALFLAAMSPEYLVEN